MYIFKCLLIIAQNETKQKISGANQCHRTAVEAGGEVDQFPAVVFAQAGSQCLGNPTLNALVDTSNHLLPPIIEEFFYITNACYLVGTFHKYMYMYSFF